MPVSRDDDSIPLREFIERVANERWIAHTEVHKALTEALRIRTDEIARRLEILNGAHAEALRVQQTYVTREVFDASRVDVGQRAEALAAEVARRAEVLAATQTGYLPREVFEAYVKEQVTRDERLAVDRSSYVSREFFDQYVKEQQTQHARVLDQLSVTYSDISSMKGRSAAYTVAIGIFFTIVTIAVSVLGRVIS